MSAHRITVSIPDHLAKRMKKIAGARPVSTWLADLIEERLEEHDLEEKWLAFYEGVSPRPQDVRRAEEILARVARKRRAA